MDSRHFLCRFEQQGCETELNVGEGPIKASEVSLLSHEAGLVRPAQANGEALMKAALTLPLWCLSFPGTLIPPREMTVHFSGEAALTRTTRLPRP